MANPMIERAGIVVTGNEPLTKASVVKKSAFLLGLCALVAFGIMFYAMTGALSASQLMILSWTGLGASVVCALVIMFKPHLAKTLAVPYAAFQGLLLGGFSAVLMARYPGIPLQALCATFGTAAIMFTLYRTGVIKVTQKLRSMVTSAILAIMLIYVVQIGFVAFGSTLPTLFDGGLVAIGFTIFVILIAAFSLLLDFDNIDRAVAAGASDDMGWLLAIGLLATLVWMYIEFLRLLSYLQE